MTDDFTIQGEWFFPKDENFKADGILSYTANDYITLVINTKSTEITTEDSFENSDIILGTSSNGKMITLCNCSMISKNIAQSKYLIRFVLINVHIETLEELKFNLISAEIFNLDEWIGISGFKKNKFNSKTNTVSVEYELPHPIEFEIDEQTRGIFNYNTGPRELSLHQKTVTIQQKVNFQAFSKQKRGIIELLDYVVKFQSFLTLAFYRNTYPLFYKLRSDAHQLQLENGTSIPIIIDLFVSHNNIIKHEIPLFGIQMLFDYNRIKNDFQTIITHWYTKYKLLEPAFDLVIEQFYKGNQFSTNTFLNLAQAAETFHARIHSRTRIPQSLYKEISSQILEIVPLEYREQFREQLNFGNNLNLHTRLEELVSKYSNDHLTKIIGDIPKFIIDVKVSRNYYTHYSKDGNKRALKNRDLFLLSEKLKLLLVCSFLMEIGINKDDISEFTRNVYWLNFNHLPLHNTSLI